MAMARARTQPVLWARRKLSRLPRAIRIALAIAILLPLLVLTNLAYHVVRKPTELFFFVGHRLDKEPSETWRQYGPLFRAYSTSTITPELLAALAQVESSGNPVDRTYWRWRWSFNPFAIYQPASSAVGLFQMTDGAYAEAARFCIRANAVTDTGCGFGPYIRAIPSHAIELASVYLDRNVAAVLARVDMTASPQQKQDVAAFIHLCGGGPATVFCPPQVSNAGRRTLWRSPRRGLCLPGQRNEAPVPSPCGRRRELECSA
jgi:hypothetical protein